jgi:hypothetical protein
MDLQEVGWVSMDWLDLAQDSKCGNEPSGSIKCSEISSLAENLLASQQGLYSMKLDG